MWSSMDHAKRKLDHSSTNAADRPSPHPDCMGNAHALDPPPNRTPRTSLRGHVFPVLHGEDDARAVVEAVAIFFGEIIDALARGDLTFGQQRLADRLAEF